MANKSQTGFVVAHTRNGSPFNEAGDSYDVVATDATALFIGDPVKLTGAVSADGTPQVTACAAGDIPVGIVVGIVADLDYINDKYRKPNTLRKVLVANTPDLVLRAQFTGAPVASPVGKYAAFIAGAGNTATGMSGYSLAAPGATEAQLKIIGVSKVVGNDPAQDNVTYDVVFHQHQML